MVKNPPSNAGDAGSIPGQGTKIPHAAGQLSPSATTTEPAHSRAITREAHTAQQRAYGPQRKILHAGTKIPRTAIKTQHSQK